MFILKRSMLLVRYNPIRSYVIIDSFEKLRIEFRLIITALLLIVTLIVVYIHYLYNISVYKVKVSGGGGLLMENIYCGLRMSYGIIDQLDKQIVT